MIPIFKLPNTFFVLSLIFLQKIQNNSNDGDDESRSKYGSIPLL